MAWFQQLVSLKKVRLVKVSGQDHVVDVGTRHLPPDVLDEYKEVLGLCDLQEDGRLSAVAKVSLAAMAVAKKTSRAFVVFALSALLTLSVRAADLEPQQVSVGFGRFDMLIAIFVSLLAGFLAGRFCYRRSCPTAEKDALTSNWVHHLNDQNRVAHVDPECVALRKVTAEKVMRRICKICGQQR